MAFALSLEGPGFDCWPSQTKYFKLAVEASLVNVRNIKQKRIDPLSEYCDRAGYHTTELRYFNETSEVIRPSVTSRHRPDMT